MAHTGGASSWTGLEPHAAHAEWPQAAQSFLNLRLPPAQPSLPYQASRLVLSPFCNTKKAASAFEKVSGSDAFLAEISQLAGLTEVEAAELVTCRRRCLDENVSVVASVVSGMVECHCSSRMQTDQIGPDCGLEIRRHLCIDEIVVSFRLLWYDAEYPEQ